MSTTVSTAQRSAFYRAALLGLRALEGAERTPRRFGGDADVRWSSFAGHLGLSERLDLLVRDAAVTWETAFSPALIFDLPGLAADEPFGPDWASLPEAEAKKLWSSPSEAVSMSALAVALEVDAAPVTLPPISAPTRLFVAGGAAICAVAEHFSAHPDLSWSDQVTVVAERPELLQLAGLAAPLTGARGPTRVVRPAEDVTRALEVAGVSAGGEAIDSDDATAQEALCARQAAGAA